MSVGVRGLRVGTGPRGHYVHAGRGGFYYRASLGSGQGHRSTRVPVTPMSPPTGNRTESAVEMIEVQSGDVLAMEDEAFADVLTELNEKHRQVRMAIMLPAGMLLVVALMLMMIGGAAIGTVALVLIAWAIGSWLDSFRRAAVLFYGVDQHAEDGFKRVCHAFDSLSACAGKWHIEAGGVVSDITTWKREAGASHIVRRSPTILEYSLPRILKCNVTPPALKVGKRTIYFLPDVALIYDDSGFGAVGYDALKLSWQPSNFIESNGVPRDANIIDHTWQHPNKSGGPDRRFKDNRKLPVCRYEALHISSRSGVNELVEFSRVGFVKPFADALAAIPRNAKMNIIGELEHAR